MKSNEPRKTPITVLSTPQGSNQKVYSWREIGESEWQVCDEEWFKFCQNSPLHDTRVWQGGA